MPAEDASRAKGARCPVCGAASDVKTRPFCSPRCRDVDLHRWLSGSYAIPTAMDDDDRDSAPSILPDDEG